MPRSWRAAPSWRGSRRASCRFRRASLALPRTRRRSHRPDRWAVRRCLAAARSRERRVLGLRREVELAGLTRIIDPNEICGGTRLLERLCDNDRDSLVIMLNFRAAKQIGVVHASPAEPWHIERRDDCDHARCGLRLFQVMRPLAIALPTMK